MKRKNKGKTAAEQMVQNNSPDTADREQGYDFDRELDAGFGEDAVTESAFAFILSRVRTVINLTNFILLICVAALLVCAIVLLDRFVDYRRTDEIYSSLSGDVFGDVANAPSILGVAGTQTPEPSLYNYNTVLASGKSQGEIKDNAAVTDIHFARVKAKLEELRAVNGDVFGWIKVEGTDINYPFVLGEDNDFYLTHAYNGEYLRSGTIFADYRCSRESIVNNYNTVLYGHNMANGAMFAPVKKFLTDTELFESAMIYVYTLDGVYVYEPFAVLQEHESFYYYRVGFPSGESFEAFASEMLEHAVHKKDVVITGKDRMITLSTCTNRASTGRVALMARLVRVDSEQSEEQKSTVRTVRYGTES